MKSVDGADVTVRPYRDSDSPAVGQLIAETFSRFNLDFAPAEQQKAFLGPFRHFASSRADHQAAIAAAIRSQVVFVSEEAGEVVGVLRGREGRLASLFVRGDRHGQGIGRMLVQRYEGHCRKKGWKVVHVASTMEAVGFYTRLGYRRSTGVRSGHSFDGTGLPIQPMKKVLSGSDGPCGQR
jgi:predicted N-acetyltransferase YhbS